jgi:cGMP-dependent protein kinase
MKDDLNIYFLTDFIRGVEMFDAIRDIGILSNSQAKFYVASMILGLEFFHFNQIVYRDLKPENIVIDAKGYMTLIDLGTCAFLKKENGYRTFTMIGTPHYMAPEIFKGRGYSFSIDFWSLGVLLYELVCGILPFGDDLDDPHEICALIQSEGLKFPSYFLQSEAYPGAKKTIEELLRKQPERRLGHESFAKLKANSWFDELDWVPSIFPLFFSIFSQDQLMDKRLPAPYRPLPVRVLMDKEIMEIEQYQIPLNAEIQKMSKKQLKKGLTKMNSILK